MLTQKEVFININLSRGALVAKPPNPSPQSTKLTKAKPRPSDKEASQNQPPLHPKEAAALPPRPATSEQIAAVAPIIKAEKPRPILLPVPPGKTSSAYLNDIFGGGGGGRATKTRLSQENAPATLSVPPKSTKVASSFTTSPSTLNRAAEDEAADKAIEAILAAAAATDRRRRKMPTPRQGAPAAPPPRPSLSAQLASIGKAAQGLTNGMRKAHGLSSGSAGEEPLLRVPARAFTVGVLQCRWPSPVSFFADRLTYVFNHPHEASQVTMVMYYGDMRELELSAGRRDLRFRVPNALREFGADFNHNDRRHVVQVSFASGSDIGAVAKVIPRASRPFRVPRTGP